MEPPEFVLRLCPDPLVARRAAFSLFVLTYLEAVGLVEGGGRYEQRVLDAAAINQHLFASAAETPFSEVDPRAADDLTGWARAQRLEREEPQVAYELGLLALSVTLPPVLVGTLRRLELRPETRVVELPDGSGYPTVFLSTLHPHWQATERSTLLVTSIDARQLAAWAQLLLTRSLPPRAGSIVVVTSGAAPPQPVHADIGLLYNTAPDLDPRALVEAERFVVV